MIRSTSLKRPDLSTRQHRLRAAAAARNGEYAQLTSGLRLPDPDEVRRLVSLGRERGLIFDSNKAAKIEKNGQDISTLGPLRSQWIEVTPELAARWLKNNFRNRSVREDVVSAYARDMANGRWVYTHQGIAFNDRDELIDGQHRLHAVILSGLAAVRMMVTF
jgi:hypothetical protein